ncbi:unnamed protein product [Sphagnum compactum]
MALKLEKLPNNVYLLTLTGDGEHRFTPSYISEILAALDEVEKDPQAAALVTTGEGRFYSNGLSLSLVNKTSRENLELLDTFHDLLKKMLTYPVPTVAAVSGHAVAGGCMFALAHDYSVMRSDKGYMFLSEVDIGLSFTPGMLALIACKLPVRTYHIAALLGHRYTGKTAEEAGMVHAARPDAHSTLQEAVKTATALAGRNYDRTIYQQIKLQMFKTEIEKLEIRHAVPQGPPSLSKL